MRKKICETLVIVILLFFTSMQSSLVYAEETIADTEDVLVFLENVIQIDMTKYEARLSTSSVDYWSWLGGLAHTTGQYILDSSGLGGTSIIKASFVFVDKELVACFLYTMQGAPIFSKQPNTDVIDAADDFLQKYQTYTNDSEVSAMRNNLETVTSKTNMTTTLGNIKLEASFKSTDSVFRWTNSFNGADFTHLNVEFMNDQFFMFSDDRSYRKIGSTEVNISEEEAVKIALECADEYSYMYQDKEITDFNILNDFVRSKIEVLSRTDPLEFYPIWIVDLPLDEVYPGSVYYIEVMLWADKGDMISCEALGYGAGPPPTDSPPDDPTSTNDQTENNVLSDALIYVGVTAVVIAFSAIGLVAIQKKRKK